MNRSIFMNFEKKFDLIRSNRNVNNNDHEKSSSKNKMNKKSQQYNFCTQ